MKKYEQVYIKHMKIKKWCFLLAVMACVLLAGCTVYYR